MVARGRGCLLFAGAAAAIVVVAAIAAYRALNPDALRRLAERRLTALAGEPVTIGHLRVRVFPVPALETTEIRMAAADAARAPSVMVRGIRILPAWRTLLSRPVVIETVEIDGLTVRLRRTQDGRWVLPGLASREGDGGTTGRPGLGEGLGGAPAAGTATVRHVRLRDGRVTLSDESGGGREGAVEAAAIAGIEAEVDQTAGGALVMSMRAALGRSPITGRLQFDREAFTALLQSPSLENGDLPALFALGGALAPQALSIAGSAPLDLEIRVRRATGELTASGRLQAASVRFGTLELSRVSAPFQLRDDTVVIEPLTAVAYGGTERGRLILRLTAPAQWRLEAHADRIDVNQFLSANTTARDRLLGTGQLAARLRGTAEAPIGRHMNGTIDLTLGDGVIRGFPLLATVNRALGISGGEGNDMRFERLSARLLVSEGVLRTDDATLAAGELRALAKGSLTFDRAIDMTGTAVFSREASARMIAAVKEISGAKNERGEVEVPFGIRGTIDQPAFSVNADQILRRALNKEIERNIRKGLERLLGKP